MQLRSFLVAAATFALSTAAPFAFPNQNAPSAPDASALDQALQSKSFAQIHAAIQGRSKQEIEADVETIMQTRHLKEVYQDLKDAVHAEVEKEGTEGKDTKEVEEEVDSALDSQAKKPAKRAPLVDRRDVAAVQAHLAAEKKEFCGGSPFFGAAGFGCGVGGLLYSLGTSPYPTGLLGGVGLLVDGLGAALGLGGLLK